MSRHLDPALMVSAHSLAETYDSHDGSSVVAPYGRHALPEPRGVPYGSDDSSSAQSVLRPYSGRHRAAYGQRIRPTPVRPVRGRTRLRRFVRQLIGETQ